MREARAVRPVHPYPSPEMNDKQLQALIRKNMAKVEKKKPKPRPAYDSTVEVTRPTDASDPSEAEEIFSEMKKREF